MNVRREFHEHEGRVCEEFAEREGRVMFDFKIQWKGLLTNCIHFF